MYPLDTGSKPFSCQQCHRQFSRQDSLARHAKLHQQNARTPSQNPAGSGLASRSLLTSSRPALDVSNSASSLSPDGATLTALSQTSPADPTLDSALELPLDADMQLTWPDSEGLLQTILSSDLSSWTMPLDILPFPQYSPVDGPNAQHPAGFNEPHNPSMDGGSLAVRHLSQMITSLVSHHTIVPNRCNCGLIRCVIVSRRDSGSGVNRHHLRLPGRLHAHVLHPVHPLVPGATSRHFHLPRLHSPRPSQRHRDWLIVQEPPRYSYQGDRASSILRAP